MIAEDLIKEEIKSWSSEVLEKPSENFSGLPPCPYAKRAWTEKKVGLHVTDDLETALRIKNRSSIGSGEVEVVAWMGWDSMSDKQFDKWIDKQNATHEGTWMIGFHPEHPVDELQEEFEGNDAPEYALILIQPLSDLSKASKRILRKGYYQKYTEEDMNHVMERNAQ
tara:strand:+ start:840 stop:1340 length:501 start_codon:yes stop_codon:yes gene_type:complete